MQRHALVLTVSIFILACGTIAVSAQQGPMMQQQPQLPQQEQERYHDGRGGTMGQGMMGQGGMMGRGMMGGGMMMRPAIMMRMIFALMDADGDGTISLQEFQAAHERVFKAMDANKDGHLSLEEMQAFMQGTRRSTPAQ